MIRLIRGPLFETRILRGLGKNHEHLRIQGKLGKSKGNYREKIKESSQDITVLKNKNMQSKESFKFYRSTVLN